MPALFRWYRIVDSAVLGLAYFRPYRWAIFIADSRSSTYSLRGLPWSAARPAPSRRVRSQVRTQPVHLTGNARASHSDEDYALNEVHIGMAARWLRRGSLGILSSLHVGRSEPFPVYALNIVRTSTHSKARGALHVDVGVKLSWADQQTLKSLSGAIRHGRERQRAPTELYLGLSAVVQTSMESVKSYRVAYLPTVFVSGGEDRRGRNGRYRPAHASGFYHGERGPRRMTQVVEECQTG